MEVGDKVIRVWDARRGKITMKSKAPGYYFIRFDDGWEEPVYQSELRVIERQISVALA